MKAVLDNDSRQALIAYRLQRALETIEEADYNSKGGYFNTAVNRLYYAAYYAASALMLAYGIERSTHAGIKSMLALNFIRKGLLDTTHGKTFMSLFENRQSGDYEDFVYCDAELYGLLRPKTADFIEALRSLIANAPASESRG